MFTFNKSDYFYVLLLFVLSPMKSLPSKICKSNSDCNPGNKIVCSVCAEDVSGQQPHCVYPLSYLYDDNKTCSPTTKCAGDCNNHGECVAVEKYVPFCKCGNAFYGSTCQYARNDSSLRQLKDFRWQFTGVITADVYTDNIFFQVDYPYYSTDRASIDIILRNDEGYYEEGRGEWNDPQCSKNICTFQDKLRLRYPYKQFDNEIKNQFLRSGDKLLGYLSTGTVLIRMVGKEIFANDFKVFVSYLNLLLTCVPLIKLSNCGPTITSPSIVTRSTLIEIQSSVSYLQDGSQISTSRPDPDCGHSATYNWFANNKASMRNRTSLFKIYDKKSIVIDPYSLCFGWHKIILNVVTVQANGKASNSAYCYFKVNSVPFVALIDGGNYKKVMKRFGLRLSARRSHDPNMPPSQQDHVYLQWSCVREGDPSALDEMCKDRRFRVSETYQVPSHQLTYGAVYKFTLIVGVEPPDLYKNCDGGELGLKYAYLSVEVGAEGDKTPNLEIQCFQNCRYSVATNQKLFLKAVFEHDVFQGYEYSWSYYKGDGGSETSADHIAVGGLPTYMLLVKEDTLEEGVYYTIVVRVEGTELVAKYSFESDNMIYKGDCEVRPTSGVKGVTPFNIKCTLFENASYTYEFYDKLAEEARKVDIFTGRMLGTSLSGRLQDLRLTRGTVCVYIMNNNGVYRNRTISIPLVDKAVTEFEVHELTRELTETMGFGDSRTTLSFISHVPDVIPIDYDKKSILNKLLTAISKVPQNTVAGVRLCASTLYNVLSTLNKPTQLTLKVDMMTQTLRTLQQIAHIFSSCVHDRELSQYLSPKEVGLVAKTLLNCLHNIYLCKDPSVTETAQDDMKMNLLFTLRNGARFTEDIINQIEDILVYVQAPGQPPTKLSSNEDTLVFWVMKNDEGFRLPQLIGMDDTIPVTIPLLLLNRLQPNIRPQEELALKVMLVQDNIFWWRMNDVKSNLTSVSLSKQVRQSKLIKINRVSPPFEIAFKLPDNLNSTRIKSSVVQPDPHADPTALDMAVKIHRLDPVPGSIISIMFIFPQTENNLRVLLTTDFRPDYDMLTNSLHTVSITPENPVYPYTHRHLDQPTFFYLGILPAPGIAVDRSVAYEIEINTTLCQFWNGVQWSSSGCRIGNATRGNEIHCQCSHMSIFAAAFPVPPQDIDPFSDAKLFLTVLDNPWVVVFVSTIVLLYIILCIVAWRKDRADRCQRNIVILEDSFPNDKYPYLVAIYTGSRFNAGTTAHIGFRIFGEASNSRAHILACSYRAILRKNSDDWFLLFCPKFLGEILSLHIWHDNAGFSPDWFCDKICVYDLSSNVESLFIVEQWIALRLNAYPEAIIQPAETLDVLNVKRVFLENFVLGLREGHILLSILLRHPRSDVSRLQRTSIFMACLMMAMLCSIMFYKPNSADTTGVDDFYYTIESREIWVSLQCLIISGIEAFILWFSFKKAYNRTYVRYRSTSLFLSSAFADTPSGSKVLSDRSDAMLQPGKLTSVHQHFAKFLSKRMRAQTFPPLQLPASKPIGKVRRFWLVIAWTTCLSVIVVCSYLVMLYSLKMGAVISMKWLTTVGATMGVDIFISGPIRIIFIALILSLSFQKMFVMNTHRVTLRDVVTAMPPQDEGYVIMVLERKRNPMYAPLREADRKKMLREQDVWKKWCTLFDFIISIVFVVVMSTVIFLLWSSHYYNNSHVINVITYSKVPYLKSQSFFKVNKIPEMDSFLQNSLTLSIFKNWWYNNIKLDSGYWSADYINRMVGLPIVRQLRVAAVSCENIIITKGKCLPCWTYFNEDTDVYGPKWSVATWSDVSISTSAWKYTTRSSIPILLINFNRLYGASGRLYDTGGYLVTLGPRWEDAEAKLTELQFQHWQDKSTRVLFVELNLYNTNTGLLSQATLILEYLVSGTVLHKAYVEALDTHLDLGLWGPLFVGFIVWYLFRSGYLINQVGLLEYLSGVNNVCRLIVVAAGFIAIAVCLRHFQYSAMYFKTFHDSGNISYFDFDSYVFYFMQTKIILSVLMSVAFLRTILFLRCGRSLVFHCYTFSISFSWIFWLTLTVAVFITTFYQLTFLLKIFSASGVKELVITKHSISQLTIEDFKRHDVQVFLFFKFTYIGAVMSIYVILFVYHTKVARNYKLKDSDMFNYFTFIAERLKNVKTGRRQTEIHE